ncbi:putative exonuclease V beta subunit recB [Mycobacterium xenopi 4042]|uniref:Putative exonuclease V beta subunit recB n=1 Tax=Mycobacterium xenopi 4042 TaxID=1299334 RepID=X7Z2V2_MYCXE|nr:putative exonuclease V beta subunit recB [Mycobacterium xenopi 4042]
MHDTPLGPLAAGLTLRQIGAGDRCGSWISRCRWPAATCATLRRGVGARRGRAAAVTPAAGDPLAPYAERLTSAPLAHQSLRGYLTGSIDVVLRIPGPRYLLADYKPTAWATAADYSAARSLRRCCTPTIRCRRCCMLLCCIGFCGGASRLRPGPISVGCCTCSCGHVRTRHTGCGVFGWRRRPAGGAFPTCSTRETGRMTDTEVATGPRSAAHVQAGRCAGRRGCACGERICALGRTGRAGGAGRGSLVRGCGRVGVRRPGGGRLDRRR